MLEVDKLINIMRTNTNMSKKKSILSLFAIYEELKFISSNNIQLLNQQLSKLLGVLIKKSNTMMLSLLLELDFVSIDTELLDKMLLQSIQHQNQKIFGFVWEAMQIKTNFSYVERALYLATNKNSCQYIHTCLVQKLETLLDLPPTPGKSNFRNVAYLTYFNARLCNNQNFINLLLASNKIHAALCALPMTTKMRLANASHLIDNQDVSVYVKRFQDSLQVKRNPRRRYNR